MIQKLGDGKETPAIKARRSRCWDRDPCKCIICGWAVAAQTERAQQCKRDRIASLPPKQKDPSQGWDQFVNGGKGEPLSPEPPILILHACASPRTGCPRARASLVAAGPAISSEARNSNPTRKSRLQNSLRQKNR